ncbi:MAG: aminotransferase class V-fold PLP-dependent enzyme, partial [Candidatus Saccharimonadales bacterium]|nr:aminotransferase class V-fold PLP-dependent enzyme [Candidatus Saccharimonadales bacterium]
MSQQSVYLDYAAATPLDPEVLKVMQPFLEGNFYNPSAGYLKGRLVRKEINNARARVAHWLGSKPTEIIFNAGVTESTNQAIIGVMNKHKQAKVLVGATEHEAVFEPAKLYNHELISVHPDGRINLEDLQAKISDEVVLVSLMHANNETGVIHPLKEVAQVIKQAKIDRQDRGVELPLLLHTDAAQT